MCYGAFTRSLSYSRPYIVMMLTLTVALSLTSFVIRSVSRELVRCACCVPCRVRSSHSSSLLLSNLPETIYPSFAIDPFLDEAQRENAVFSRWRNPGRRSLTTTKGKLRYPNCSLLSSLVSFAPSAARRSCSAVRKVLTASSRMQ